MGDTAVEEILGRDGWGDISAVKNGACIMPIPTRFPVRARA